MVVKTYKVSVLEEDSVEYGVPTEVDLLNALKGIKFGGFQRFYVDTDEILAIDAQESYTISNTMYCSGTITLDGILGVN